MLPERPAQLTGLVLEQAGHESLLYHASGQADGAHDQGGAIHALNPTARLIWDLCDGAHTVAEIEVALRAAFEVPAEHDLQGDIHRTLEVFWRKGLLSVAADPRPTHDGQPDGLGRGVTDAAGLA